MFRLIGFRFHNFWFKLYSWLGTQNQYEQYNIQQIIIISFMGVDDHALSKEPRFNNVITIVGCSLIYLLMHINTYLIVMNNNYY